MWRSLSPEEATAHFRVPKAVAFHELNRFFGLPLNPFDSDGPWPLVAILRYPETPNIATLQIFSVWPESLQHENFNPLTEPGGFLYLGKETSRSLISILQDARAQLAHNDGTPECEILPLSQDKLSELRLRPGRFPATRQSYYYQTCNPLNPRGLPGSFTAIVFSTGSISQAPVSLYFKIAYFSLDDLLEPSFDPEQDAVAALHLDPKSLGGLISVLEKESSLLVGS